MNMKHIKNISPLRECEITQAHSDFALALINLYLNLFAPEKKEELNT